MPFMSTSKDFSGNSSDGSLHSGRTENTELLDVLVPESVTLACKLDYNEVRGCAKNLLNSSQLV